MRSDISNSELASSYCIFRCDRSSATSDLQRGGGVLIAVKATLNCRSVVLENCDNLEQAVICLKLQNSTVYVCGIYLRPNSQPALYSSHSTAIQQLCERMSGSDTIVVVGDYNLPQLIWQEDEDVNGLLPSNASSEQEIVLVESTIASGLHQINSLSNANGRLLDLAFVNEPSDVELIEPPSSLLKIDNHHMPFVLRIDVNGAHMQPARNLDQIDDFDF